jgi:hypothetical protein
MISRSNVTVTALRQGAILGTIAHAMSLLEDPLLAGEQSWDGANYNIQNTAGALGTVTFEDSLLVAAFFEAHSDRNPARSGGPAQEAGSLLDRAPESVRSLAHRETMHYLLQEIHGEERPAFTSVFWSEDGYLVGPEPWEDVMAHGGHLIRTQLLPIPYALARWGEILGLTGSELQVVHDLFLRTIREPRGNVHISVADFTQTRPAPSPSGLQACRAALEDVGIQLD